MKTSVNTEYRVYYSNEDVDHVSLKEARQMIKNKPADILLIEKVTRTWDAETEDLIHEVAVTMYPEEEKGFTTYI